VGTSESFVCLIALATETLLCIAIPNARYIDNIANIEKGWRESECDDTRRITGKKNLYFH
jgi:hypothetical protein